jgi:hypothetical protein
VQHILLKWLWTVVLHSTEDTAKQNLLQCLTYGLRAVYWVNELMSIEFKLAFILIETYRQSVRCHLLNGVLTE